MLCRTSQTGNKSGVKSCAQQYSTTMYSTRISTKIRSRQHSRSLCRQRSWINRLTNVTDKRVGLSMDFFPQVGNESSAWTTKTIRNFAWIKSSLVGVALMPVLTRTLNTMCREKQKKRWQLNSYFPTQTCDKIHLTCMIDCCWTN